MKASLFTLCVLASYLLAGCSGVGSASFDTSGPAIDRITTSTKSFSIDCAPTSVTVTAHITDPSGISHARLFYRVKSDRPYISMDMAASSGDNFTATVKGVDLPIGEYGAWQYYITAEDKAGYQSKTSTDASIQFLPCVSH